MPFATINGIKIHYDLLGSKQGMPVVLTGGGRDPGSCMLEFAKTINSLKKQEERTALPDLGQAQFTGAIGCRLSQRDYYAAVLRIRASGRRPIQADEMPGHVSRSFDR